MFYPHSEYSIYNSNGSRLRWVANHMSLRDETPETVSLPAGTYTVVADSDFDGQVKIPVRIAGGRTTRVNLEGSRAIGNHDYVDPAHAVTTPSGQIVGWRTAS